jgi:hypothetical protein
MKTLITLRVAAAAASFGTTFVLFSLVAALFEPPQSMAGVQVAQATATVKS